MYRDLQINTICFYTYTISTVDLCYFILFRSQTKQHLLMLNHAQIRSWNQPVLSNDGKVLCSRKQREPLLGTGLKTDKHPPTTSHTRYPVHHEHDAITLLQFRTSNHYFPTEIGIWKGLDISE